MLSIKNNQKGSSLVEALGLISVIGILAISTLKIIATAYGVLKISMATSEIRELQKTWSGVYDYSGNYNQLFQDNVYKTLCEKDKVAPSQMCMKTSDGYFLIHRLSGGVTIAKSGDSVGYSITFGDLSKKGCVDLSQIDWLDRKKISIYQLNINDTPIAYYPKKGNKGFPLKIKDIFDNCSKNDGENSITWFFY